MQVAEEKKNIVQEEVRSSRMRAGSPRFRDDADIPTGLDRLDLILEADANKRVVDEIKQRLDNIDAMIAYILNELDAGDLGVEDSEAYEDPDADADDDPIWIDEPFGPPDDPYADIEIPPPEGWDPDFDGEVPEGHGRLPHGLDPNREHWRDIDGFPNYEVSHHGNVRNKTTGRFLRPFPNQKGYLRVELRHAGRGKTHCVHVLVADAWIPKIDDKPQVDHIDRNKANNMLHNLRRCTPEENMWNRGLLRTNTTGVRGVTRCGNKYRADITANKRKHYLGLFDTLEEAAAARRRAEVELHGAFAG